MMFVALTILMSHARKPMLYDYWNTNDVLNTPVFRKYMARDRYRDILRYSHYAKNETDEDDNDPVWKVTYVLQNTRQKYKVF